MAKCRHCKREYTHAYYCPRRATSPFGEVRASDTDVATWGSGSTGYDSSAGSCDSGSSSGGGCE